MGECLGLNSYRQQWEAACKDALCNSAMKSPYTFPYKLHNFELQPGKNLSNIETKLYFDTCGCIFTSGGDIQKIFDQTLENCLLWRWLAIDYWLCIHGYWISAHRITFHHHAK